jgi:hypothetical protein
LKGLSVLLTKAMQSGPRAAVIPSIAQKTDNGGHKV